MNFFSKNRFLFWLLLFLVILNLSGLITFFVLYPRPAADTGMSACDRSVCMMEQELDLDTIQAGKVASIQVAYRDSAAPISDSIKKIRSELLTVLSKDPVSQAQVDTLTLRLGKLQMELQKASIRHYIALKAVCTPGQAQKLSNLFFELYECPRKAQGMQHQRRQGRK